MNAAPKRRPGRPPGRTARLAGDLLAILAAPAPCDGCIWHRHCAAHPVACRAFEVYVAGRTWQRITARPLPSTRTYRALFAPEEEVPAGRSQLKERNGKASKRAPAAGRARAPGRAPAGGSVQAGAP